MTAAEIQAQLEACYRTELAAVRVALTAEDLEVLSFPFLLNVSPEYVEAPIRLMFVGKETNRWAGKLRDFYARSGDAFVDAMKRYDTQYEKHWNSWSTPFGREYKNMIRAAGLQATPRATLWNNLVKMDWDQGNRNSRRALGHSRTLRELSSRIFRREIELLKPEVIVFATGASYDHAIKVCLEITDWHDHMPRAVSTFSAAEAKCVRLRHPGAIPSRNFPVPTAHYFEYVARWIEALRVQPRELRTLPPEEWLVPLRSRCQRARA